MAGRQANTHWRHRCPEMPLGRRKQFAWRPLLKGEDCELCGDKDPKAGQDKSNRKQAGKNKAAGFEQITLKIPTKDRQEARDHAALLCRRHVESTTLCQGQYEHIMINGQCARCKETLK